MTRRRNPAQHRTPGRATGPLSLPTAKTTGRFVAIATVAPLLTTGQMQAVAESPKPIDEVAPTTITAPPNAAVSFALPTLTTVDASGFEETRLQQREAVAARQRAANQAVIDKAAADQAAEEAAAAAQRATVQASRAAHRAPLAVATAPTTTTPKHAVAPAVVAPTGSRGQQVVDIARKYLGVPYLYGGSNPSVGLDCSGLTQLVYRQVGLTLPRTSGAQAGVGTAVTEAAAQPGDLVVFGAPVHHVAIYIGGGKMIAAPHAGEDVQVESVYSDHTRYLRVL